MKRYFLFLVSVTVVLGVSGFFSSNALGSSLFDKYKVPVEQIRLKQKLDFKGLSLREQDKQLIIQAVAGGVNFAGGYRLVFWGCGTSCTTGVVVDLKTGGMVRIPTAEWGLQFRIDSTLLAVNPIDSNGANAASRPAWAAPRFFNWQNNRFYKLKID